MAVAARGGEVLRQALAYNLKAATGMLLQTPRSGGMHCGMHLSAAA